MYKTDPTEEVFLKDVAKHEMNVRLDNGVYRHLRFKQPNSSIAWFDIVTWPGHLAYTGDMGSFTFRRLDDMFEFFRSDRRPDRLGINQSYWAEKLQAVDRNGRGGEYKEFSNALLRQNVEERIARWVEECPIPLELEENLEPEARKAFEADIRAAIEAQIYMYIDDGEQELSKAVRDFDRTISGHRYRFEDAWEWDCSDYTYRFTWCCYALAWSIRKYDDAKAAAAPQAVEVGA